MPKHRDRQLDTLLSARRTKHEEEPHHYHQRSLHRGYPGDHGVATTTAAPKSAVRSTVAGALSASSGFPTVCPPAAVVGKALGRTVSKPTVVIYAKGLALECKYVSGKSKTTLSYMSETRKAFLGGWCELKDCC